MLKALTGGSTEMPKNWNRRFKHNRDKMKTGDVFELAEVVRNLALRDHEKGLSTGEKQMFVKAKKILASELMYAKTMDEDECAEWLEEVLANDAPARRRRRRRRRRPSPRRPSYSCRSGRSSSQPGAARGSAWIIRKRSRSSARIRSSPSRCAASTSPSGSTRSCSSRRPAGRSPRSCLPRSSAAARCSACVPGGETRADSVRAGLAEVPADAVSCSCTTRRGRCWPRAVIERVLAPLSDGWDGAVPGVPVSDTLKRVGADGAVLETVDARLALCRPDAAGVSGRRAAPRPRERRGCDGLRRPRRGVRRPRQGRPRRSAAPEGHHGRRPREDRFVAVSEYRVGTGFDAHAFEDGVPLVLGGVRIEHPRGLAGHSDGDVLAHALTDAVLGAAGLRTSARSSRRASLRSRAPTRSICCASVAPRARGRLGARERRRRADR